MPSKSRRMMGPDGVALAARIGTISPFTLRSTSMKPPTSVFVPPYTFTTASS